MSWPTYHTSTVRVQQAGVGGQIHYTPDDVDDWDDDDPDDDLDI